MARERQTITEAEDMLQNKAQWKTATRLYKKIFRYQKVRTVSFLAHWLGKDFKSIQFFTISEAVHMGKTNQLNDGRSQRI